MDWREDRHKALLNGWKIAKRFAITILIISAPLTIFTPKSSTIIQMYVASVITPANISKAIDTGKNVKDELIKDIRLILSDTVDIVKEVKEKTR